MIVIAEKKPLKSAIMRPATCHADMPLYADMRAICIATPRFAAATPVALRRAMKAFRHAAAASQPPRFS
jgi:hypothetical protein